MVNIISKNGMFFKEIPFTLENAKAIQSGSKRGFCVLDDGMCTPNNARIIATDIDNPKPIVVAVRFDNEEVIRVDDNGRGNIGGRFRLYVPTRINTYENFTPSLYQACLIRYPNVINSSWMIEVCNGYLDDEKPTFFGKRTSVEWEYVPLCKTTLPLLNLCNISWLEYIQTSLRNDED